MTRQTLRIVRWGVFLAAGIFLYLRLFVGQSTHGVWGDVRQALYGAPAWFWPLMLVLTALNWGLEAAKWRWLVGHLEPMGRWRAFAATLAGTSIGLVTPNRTGEFAGRVLFLAPENRWQGAFATVLGSMAQFVTTVVLGGIAMVPWWYGAWPVDGLAAWGSMALMALAALVALGTLVVYFRPRLLHQLVLMVPLLRRLGRSAEVLQGYSTRDLASVLGLSMARYAVFWLQYVLALHVFAEVGWEMGAWLVPVIYLIVTLVPTMMLTELGVRGSVAVAVLAPLGGAPALVLMASFGVWAVNLALPAMVGAVIMLVARIGTRP